jgi:PAS domain S-box-containing protein
LADAAQSSGPAPSSSRNAAPHDPSALLAAIVASSDDAIISKTLDGIITSWNAGAARLYGYSESEVVGKHVSMLAPPERADEIPRILEQLKKGERVEHYRSVRVTKDGRRLDVSITISPIRDANGSIVGASAIARDVTELEQVRSNLEETNSRAAALFQTAAQAIFIVDSSGKIIMANPATEAMFGYTVEELIGQSVDLLIPENLRERHKKQRQGYFDRPQTRPMGLGLELQGRRKDGSVFHAEISLSYMSSSQGTLGVAFVSDVSKRRADELAILRQREDLRALAAQLVTAQEDERRRIARNLHDDLSQTLAHLSIDIGRLATHSSAEAVTDELRRLQHRATQAAEAVRRISHELHPSVLDDIGLEGALEQYCIDFE